ncbi:MAG TPA: ABC transporter ATP-binding protein [Anaerolineales bacterium]|nr:ABC transporter ATP-binding protein [Anaerolineales bacterium]HLB47880.1 ABC transporter ATP-binding protein [Anaerolineales bacterium]
MPALAVETHNLRKEFGDNVAVRGLTLEVQQGEVFGFLGPNGAGKTTSIKMLLGLVAPTSGNAKLLGTPIGDRAARARVGFLPEHFRFHDWLTAAEFLRLHGQLYGMTADRLKQRIPELLDLVGLTQFRDKQLRTFSKGMLQRIGLAQALLNDPALVFLDEPTSGLDPVGRRLVRDIIRDLRARGTTVFLNSHLLSEVEITCDRVAFIKHGEVIRVSELKTLVDGETSVAIRAGRLTPEIVTGLSQWGRDTRADGDHLTLTVSDDAALPAITRYLVAQGAEVYAITPQRLSLEDLFIQIVGTDGGL